MQTIAKHTTLLKLATTYHFLLFDSAANDFEERAAKTTPSGHKRVSAMHVAIVTALDSSNSSSEIHSGRCVHADDHIAAMSD